MNGLDLEHIGGIVGVTLVLTSSVAFEPLKDWCRTRAHGFWAWASSAIGDPLWVGFALGALMSVHLGNAAVDTFLMGGVTAVVSHVSEDALAILGSVASVTVRRLAVPAPMQMPHVKRRSDVPNARLPDLSEEEAHRIMDSREDSGE